MQFLGQTWIPAFAGMTGWKVNDLAGWDYTNRPKH